jgi:hypothetical protein
MDFHSKGINEQAHMGKDIWIGFISTFKFCEGEYLGLVSASDSSKFLVLCCLIKILL